MAGLPEVGFNAEQILLIERKVTEGLQHFSANSERMQLLVQATSEARAIADSAVSRLDVTQTVAEGKFAELKNEQQIILEGLMQNIRETAEATQRNVDESLANLKELSRQADEASRASLQGLEQARVAQMEEIEKVRTSASEGQAKLDQVKSEVGAYVVGKQNEIKAQTDEKQKTVKRNFEVGEQNIQGMHDKNAAEMRELEEKVKVSLTKL